MIFPRIVTTQFIQTKIDVQLTMPNSYNILVTLMQKVLRLHLTLLSSKLQMLVGGIALREQQHHSTTSLYKDSIQVAVIQTAKPLEDKQTAFVIHF